MAANPKEPASTAMVARQATPDDMIFAGIKANVPIETLERLYALKQKYEADEARKAYVEAMAEFKKNPPEILKSSRVFFKGKDGKADTSYYHADLGNVCQQIVSALAAHGFSHAWDVKMEGGVVVTCTITHKQGHSERIVMPPAPIDQSGNKNTIQGIASTQTYMQRYSLLAITGLATVGMDNDGRGDPDAGKDEADNLTEAEQQTVEDWINNAAVNRVRFYEWASRTTGLVIEKVADMPRSHYQNILNQLKNTATQKGLVK
jgi:hypothetical protein